MASFPSPYFRAEYGRVVDLIRNGKKKSARLPQNYVLGPGVTINFQPFSWMTGFGKILTGTITKLEVGISGKVTITIGTTPPPTGVAMDFSKKTNSMYVGAISAFAA